MLFVTVLCSYVGLFDVCIMAIVEWQINHLLLLNYYYFYY